MSMRVVVIVCVVMGLGGCGRPEKPPAGCPGDRGFDRASIVSFAASFPEPVLRRDLDTRGIQALSPTPHAQARVPGLTVGEYGFKKDYRISSSGRGLSGGRCVWLDSLKVDFSYAKLDVYVSRDYPDGSCEQVFANQHEMEHVETNRRVHARYAALLEQALRSAPGLPTRANPAAVDSQEAGRKLIDQAVSEATEPLYRAFEEELQVEQAKLDTPELYRGMQGLCKGWK